MNTKTVVLNAKKMNFDGKLDFSILSSQVAVYDDTAPEELLERIQDADVIVTKENARERRPDPPVPGLRKIDLRGWHRLQQSGSGRRQGKGHHGLQYPGLQHPESRPDRDHADLKLKLRHAGPDGNACQRQS